MELKSTGEVGVFQWNLPSRPRGLLCSLEFYKFDRKWRLLLNEKVVALEFSQGVKPVHMDLRYEQWKPAKSAVLATLLTSYSDGLSRKSACSIGILRISLEFYLFLSS